MRFSITTTMLRVSLTTLRVSLMKSRRGSVFVLVLAVVPLFVVVLAFVINIGQLMYARARLQTNLDRAAYAGAASMADSLNEMAAQNWNIHKAWRDLSRDFRNDSQRDRSTAERRHGQYEAERDAALGEMETVVNEMCWKSEAVTTDTLLMNGSDVEPEVVVLGCDQWPGSSEDEIEEARVGYSYITGTSFIDPDDVEHGGYETLKYVRRKRTPASVGVMGSRVVRPLLLKNIFGEDIFIQAVSAAQAFGGSIELFAQKETDTIEEAEGLTDDDGDDDLYRMSLIPVQSLTEVAEVW